MSKISATHIKLDKTMKKIERILILSKNIEYEVTKKGI